MSIQLLVVKGHFKNKGKKRYIIEKSCISLKELSLYYHSKGVLFMYDKSVKIITKTIAKRSMRFDYPSIVCMKDHAVQQRINMLISAEINRMLADTAGCEAMPESQITGWYEIKTNTNMVLSLSLVMYYYCGGAHGMTIIKSMTFNTDTGILYKLEDQFVPGSNYIQRINEIITGQITQRDMSYSINFTGISSDQDYYIADKTIVIYFQLYEILCYAAGFQYFPISLYELGEVIKQGTPAELMMNYSY